MATKNTAAATASAEVCRRESALTRGEGQRLQVWGGGGREG